MQEAGRVAGEIRVLSNEQEADMTVHRTPFVGRRHPHSAAVVAPLDQQDRHYHWELRDTAAGERIYAPTADDLLDHWLPGYLTRSRDDQLVLRIEHAAGVRAELAARFVADAEQGGDRLPDGVRAVLLGSAWEPPEVGEWTHTVPLVLLDVLFAPFTERPAPTSSHGDVEDAPNLRWLRPSGPTKYLRSLAAAGWASLAENHG